MSSLAEVTTVTVAERNALVMANQGLVGSVARRFTGRGLAFDDLCQWGQLGLLRAAELYDPSRGYRFSTYSQTWIAKFIQYGISESNKPVHVPAWIGKLYSAYCRTIVAMTAELGHEPAFAEVIARMGVKPKHVPFVYSAHLANRSGFQDRTVPLKYLKAPEYDGLSTLIRAEDMGRLAAAVRSLDPDRREVLTLRYGLDDGRPLPLRTVGRRMGISRQTVLNWERSAIAELRRFLNQDHDGESSCS